MAQPTISWKSFSKLKEELEDERPKQNSEKMVCKGCGKDTLMKELEGIICSSCGMENGSNISKLHEWKNFDKENGNAGDDRCGIPINPLLPKSSMSTMILGSGKEFIRKLDRWNDTIHKEKSLMKVFGKIHTECKSEGIPSCVVNKANMLYKILSDSIIKRGDQRTSIIAACVYYACLDYSYKNRNFNKSHTEIARIFGITKKHMTKGCKCFNAIMYQQINENDYSFMNKIVPKTADYYIRTHCKKLAITNKQVVDNIIKIEENVKKLGIINENTPRSVSVACIYLHEYRDKTKQQLITLRKQLATVCKISEVTILKSYKKLEIWEKFLIISCSGQPHTI